MRVIIKLNEISDQSLNIIRGVQQLGHNAAVITTCEDPQIMAKLRRSLAHNQTTVELFQWAPQTAISRPQNAILLQSFLLSLRPDLLVNIASSQDPHAEAGLDTGLEAESNPDPTLDLGDQALLHPIAVVTCDEGDVSLDGDGDQQLPLILKQALSGVQSICEQSKSEQSSDGERSDEETRDVQAQNKQNSHGEKSKLAMVGPTLPSQSGIAVYTDELVLALSEFYDITLIDTTPVSLREGKHSSVHPDLEWFAEHSHEFDRVVYQIGN